MVEISTGDYKVLASGVFHAVANEETKITVADLVLRIRFEDAEEGKPEVKAQSDGKSALLTFVNFYGPLGAGNTVPLKIGSLNQKELYFSYRISSLDDKTLRTFEYTLYERNA